jgi:uncharacterized protein (DUF433 family)
MPIVKTPNVLGGKPRVAVTRISVSILFSMFRHGISDSKILEDYPRLTSEDLKDVRRFIDDNLRETAIDLV